jgi:alkyl hydroperoxide reductase subunit AhpC
MFSPNSIGYERLRGETVILKMNDIAPDFVAETTQGTIRLHEWMGADWVVLFSHPKAFSRICTSELTKLAVRQSEFVNRSVKLIGVGADPVPRQMALAEKIQQATGARINFPIIGDPNLEVLTLYNMLATDGSPDEQSAAHPEVTTVRSVFVFGPDKRIRLMLAYPMETARNFDEILRVIDSLRATALYNTRTLNADDGVVALPIMSEEKTSRGRLGFKALFASLRHEILPF